MSRSRHRPRLSRATINALTAQFACPSCESAVAVDLRSGGASPVRVSVTHAADCPVDVEMRQRRMESVQVVIDPKTGTSNREVYRKLLEAGGES